MSELDTPNTPSLPVTITTTGNPPAEALDFEAADRDSCENGTVWSPGYAQRYRAALNAQVRALLARKDERIKEMQADIADMRVAEECRPHAISSTRLREAVRKLYRHLEVR